MKALRYLVLVLVFNPSIINCQWHWQNSTLIGRPIYAIIGKEIATLVNEEQPAGNYIAEFKSSVGSHLLANGVYFYSLQVGDFNGTKMMLLIK